MFNIKKDKHKKLSRKIDRVLIKVSRFGLYSLLLSQLVFISSTYAGPSGGEVVGGSGNISQSGVNTTINQTTQNLTIDWQSYNVNVDERVQYIQPNASSVSLNRILSQNGSTIAGKIDANGQVILVNPNGIFFTSTSILNVGGIIASGLDIQPADFMNGNYIFDEVLGTDGTVINSGMINAALGGNVALIGRQVENDGLIVANLGSVSLAAGKQAILTFDAVGVLGVRVSKEILQEELGVDPAVINSGDIQVEGGRVLLTASTSQDVFSEAVNTNSLEPATSVVVHEDGSFTLGGGADVLNTGSIDTSTTSSDQNIGRIVLVGENVTSSGELRAVAVSGNGGDIEIHAGDMALLTESSLTSARSESDGLGGIVKVLGDKVGLFDQSTIDVSGEMGGGQALVGGDFQGANDKIRNATTTIVNSDSNIFSDAILTGNGGKVILWSDQTTYFWGGIYARGGEQYGNGGFVETSGKDNLLFAGYTDTMAINGQNGLLFLDPKNITIVSGNDSVGTEENNELTPSSDLEILFDDGTSSDFNITANRLELVLASGDVLLEAREDITVDANITANTGNTNNLTLVAGDDILVRNTGSIYLIGGDLTMTSGAYCGSGGTCKANNSPDVTIEGSLNTTGDIIIYSAEKVLIREAIGNTSAPSSLTVRAGEGIIVDATGHNGSITASGNITFIASDDSLVGAITVAPDLNIGNIIIEGDVLTGGGDFIATIDNGDFNNLFTDQNLNAGAGSVTISATTEARLGDITAGSLSVTTSAGQIIQSLDPAQFLTIAGASSFDAGANPIGLQNPFNNLQGAISLTTTGANNADLVNASATTTLDIVNIGGDFTISADQGLTLANDITVGGAAQLNFGQDNTGATFTVPSSLTLTTGSISVSGGDGNDTFGIASTIAGNLNGWLGSDLFNLGADITGTVDGGQDADTFNITANISGILDGNDGDDIFNINTAALILADLRGGIGTDTLNGHDSANTWAISAANSGTLTNGMAITTFAEMESLNGALNNDDAFNFSVTPTVANVSIDGQGHVSQDSVDLSTLVGDTISVQLGATGFSNIELITGNNTGSTLIGTNGGDTWAITGENDGTVGSLSFVDFNNLTGGTGDDTFNFGATITGIVDGDAGNDTFNINAAALTLTDLRGGIDTDTLYGHDSANVWTISAANSGTLMNGVGTTTFDEMESLAGALNNDDAFNFSVTPTVANVTIDGQGHISQDSVDLSILIGDAISVQLGATGFSNIELITGNNTNSTLIGTNAGDTWAITGENDGTVGSLSFVNFNNLTGGTSNDTFNFGATITGFVDGDTGNDTFNINAAALTLANLSGGVGTDTLSGHDSANVWTISAANSGTLMNGVDTTTFAEMESLNGALNNDDTFNFTVTPTVANVAIDGQGHVLQDSVDLSALVGDSLIVQLGATGFNGIELITGNNTNSTLLGTNGGDTWNITGENDGTVGSLSFVDFNNLTGGTGDDTFFVTANVTGVIDGGTNTGGDVSFINSAEDQIVQLGSAVVGGEDFTITNIETIDASGTTGNAVGNTLRADTGDNAWSITTANEGTVVNGSDTVAFSNFSNLVGNNTVDTFTVDAAIASITAGNGINDITITALGSVTNAITTGIDDDAINITGSANSITTGAGIDTINVSGSATSINSGAGDDVITLFGTVTGLIDGGAGAGDSLTITAGGDSTIQLGTLINGNINVYQVEDIVAKAATVNTLLADNTSNTWTIDGMQSGSVFDGTTNASFSNVTNVVGGSVVDDITVTATGSITNIIGGTGADIFNIDGQVTTLDGGDDNDIININNSGTVTTLNGGAGNDSITLFGTVDGLISGGAGLTDSLVIAAAAGISTVEIGSDLTANLNVDQVEIITDNSGATDTTLIAEDFLNTWSINSANSGSLTGGTTPVTFINFENLTGGNSNDTFNINGPNGGIDGLVNGGAGADTLNILTSGNKNVQIGNLVNGRINVYQVENINANSLATNTLYGDAIDSTWTINGINGGSVNSATGTTTFTNFNNLYGGSAVDQFTVLSGSVNLIDMGGGDDFFTITGGTVATVLGNTGDDIFTDSGGSVDSMDGGDGIDSVVDTSAVVDITLGASFGGFEGVVAQNGIGIINARSGETTYWVIDGNNSGSVSSDSSDSLSFSGFTTINGGSGVDDFSIGANGSIEGTISGGGDNDTLSIDLDNARTQSGVVNFDGGLGNTDVVTVTSTELPVGTFSETYNANIAGYDQLSYENGGITFDVNYHETETVNDNIQTSSLTINSSVLISDTIQLGNNTFGTTEGMIDVNFAANSKSDVLITAQNADTFEITGDIGILGDLSISNVGSIAGVAAGTITATGLVLDGVNQAGTGTDRLSTDVTNLTVRNHTGLIFIEELNGINIAEITNTSGAIDISTVAGPITSNADLITSGTLNFNTTGDINLSGNNILTGGLSLVGADINVNNTAATATRLAGVTAQNLTVTSVGGIADFGTIDVSSGLASLESTTGSIILNNANNNFDIVNLNAANDATLIESDGITISNTAISGALSVTSNSGLAANDAAIGNMALGSISADTISLNAGEGAIVNQSSNLTANSITLAAASGIGNGNVSVNSSGDFTVNDFGAITTITSMLSVTNSSSEGVGMTSGAVNITNTGNVTINDLRNYGDIIFTNSGNMSLAVTGAGTPTARGAIDANYGGDVAAPMYGGSVAILNGGDNVATMGVGLAEADITAENLIVNSVIRFGESTVPIRLRVNNQFTLFASQGAVSYLFDGPDNVTTSSELALLVIEGNTGLSGQQLIDLETLSEINEAIFTEVRNYNYDDIAILLPADQRYGEDDDENERDIGYVQK